MPISVKLKLDWGQYLYIINDPEQNPHLLVGVVQRPGSVSYMLSYLGDVTECYDFEVSEEINQKILLNLPEED